MSGDGHLNMNLLKTFFKITEKIKLEPLGKEILNTILKNHLIILSTVKITTKHGKLLTYIFPNGTIMELIRMYCAEETNTPTPTGFLNWQSAVESPMLKLVCELTLNI